MRFLSALLVGAMVLSSACTSGPEPTESRTIDAVRGQQFHEIVVIRRVGLSEVTETYGNFGLSSPMTRAEWSALPAETIRERLGARTVVKRGPMIWTLDAQTIRVPDRDTVHFEAHEFRFTGTLPTPERELLSRKPYVERTVPQRSTRTFVGGQPVHELVGPNGAVYVMIALSRELEPELELGDLEDHDLRLEKPNGWTYRVRVPETDMVLKASGRATVIEDDTRCVYQRADNVAGGKAKTPKKAAPKGTPGK